jgi:hypothetical protein
MRTALAFSILLLGAGLALANPTPVWPGVFIDFDEDGIPDDDVHTSIYPFPYQSFSAYVALVCNDQPGEEFAAISFMLTDVMAACPGVFAPPTFTNLLPGDLAIGNWNTGITIASTECLTAPMVYIGRLDLFFLGYSEPCEIRILEHPDYPRWVVDCNQEVHYYGVASHGGVNMEPEFPGEGEFACTVTPVEDVSWGGIKALFR